MWSFFPHMAPTWWTMLMMMTILMSMMVNSILYFNSMEMNKSNPQTSKEPSMIWKW